ncbi:MULTISPECIES: DUF695 domain-containing protein [unclassified Breznakia]|uniref:DUF695 domain-containing protein n=1 Tax=unclassified Breznakia TaxID=2623764 RepID=UPI002475E471|nr:MULTISPECIES: DUF695 domain-containing protein [unclassified Breznakia]MDH6366889.1 regulator of RNase E activity RraB [Breznakia sp. PH1-1]MDH6404067.1 regulator of RNase E activity RraB [Breznakia sp. PF1-11]MDH6411711.1 regulator of RNase E activity RraB [Breznakia sp. PFB1-11]MDH6414055.1 regulator of RNase E activity RraB [Breznakia sp. PFB1-14]MDH6416485.1 regulator of RNase E activity RraB [Breznakia sp. PFB1-4]
MKLNVMKPKIKKPNIKAPKVLKPKQKHSVNKLSEDWRVYFKGNTSVRFDYGAFKYLFRDLEHTYILTIHYDQQNDLGFPTKEELEKLYLVEDQIEKQWGRKGFYFVGTRTQDGNRDFVFMSKHIIRWESMCNQLLRNHKDLQSKIVTRLHDHGKFYQTKLYPDAYGFNWIKNDTIINDLRNQGELFCKAREIDFYTYFETNEQAKAFASSLDDVFADIHELDICEVERKGIQVFVSVVDIPQMDYIMQTTNALITLAKDHDGEFDGWGTTIEKD